MIANENQYKLRIVTDCLSHDFLRQQIKLEKNYSLLKNTNNTDRLQKQFTLPEYKVLNTFFKPVCISKLAFFVNQI